MAVPTAEQYLETARQALAAAGAALEVALGLLDLEWEHPARAHLQELAWFLVQAWEALAAAAPAGVMSLAPVTSAWNWSKSGPASSRVRPATAASPAPVTSTMVPAACAGTWSMSTPLEMKAPSGPA
mgnify:CR=1 FL=1